MPFFHSSTVFLCVRLCPSLQGGPSSFPWTPCPHGAWLWGHASLGNTHDKWTSPLSILRAKEAEGDQRDALTTHRVKDWEGKDEVSGQTEEQGLPFPGPPDPAVPARSPLGHTSSYLRSKGAEEQMWTRRVKWTGTTVEYYSAIKKNTFEPVLMRSMKLEPIIQSEVSKNEKHQYCILMHIYGI